MEKRYQFRGDLAEQPLAEILFKIYQYRLPGVIEAIEGERVKRIHVRGGFIVAATSSDLEESLGNYLLKSGRISREDFRHTMRERRSSGRRYGALLVDSGLLAPTDLYESVQGQMAEIVWDLFSWDRGQISFSIGEFQDPVPVLTQLPLRYVIKEGCRRVSDARALLSRIGGKSTRLEASFELEDLVDVRLDLDEYQLIRQVDRQRTLVELCSEGPLDVKTNGLLLYAFWVLHLVRVVEAKTPPSGSIKIRLTTRKQFQD